MGGGGGGVLGGALVAGLHGEGVAGGGAESGRGIGRAVLPRAAGCQRDIVEAVFHAVRVAGGGGRHGDRGGAGRCRRRREGHRIRRRRGGVCRSAGGGEVPVRVVGDAGEAVACGVVDGGRGDPDGVTRAAQEVHSRVDRQDVAGDRDLSGVGDGYGSNDLIVARGSERDIAGDPDDVFAKGRHEVRADRHAGGVVGWIAVGDRRHGGVGGGGEVPSGVVGDPQETVTRCVINGSRGNLNGVVPAVKEVGRRVDRQGCTGDRHLGGVRDSDGRLGRVGQVLERDGAGADDDRLGEGRHEVR